MVLQTVSKCTMSVVCAQAREFLRELAIALAKSTTVLEFAAEQLPLTASGNVADERHALSLSLNLSLSRPSQSPWDATV